MPITSRWEVPIDVISVHASLFGSPSAPLPERVAFYDADLPSTRFLTLESLRLWSLRLAAGLQKAGLQPGDRVLVYSGNNLLYPAVFLAILMAGGIFTGANPGYVTRELAYQLKDSGASFLFCADESLESGIEAAQSIGMGKERVFRFDDSLLDGTGTSRLGVKNWKTLIEPEFVGKRFKWHEVLDPKDTVCCLNYSSGTTGVPKGVMITHYNYIANATQFCHLAEVDPNEAQKRKAAQVTYPYYILHETNVGEQELVMFPTPLSRNGANNIHLCGIKASDPCLYDEEVRFCCCVGGNTEI
jgi:4-coumarate--CoA ligase